MPANAAAERAGRRGVARVGGFYGRFARRALAGAAARDKVSLMRLSSLLALVLLAAAPALSWAQPASPAKPSAPAATATEEGGEKEEPKIPGVTLARPDGRFLGVETEGVTMKVTFYDKDKKKEAADVVRISARWTDNKPRLTVLLPSTPETMVSPGVMRRPFNYNVYLALIGADEKVKESHSLRLQ